MTEDYKNTAQEVKDIQALANHWFTGLQDISRKYNNMSAANTISVVMLNSIRITKDSFTKEQKNQWLNAIIASILVEMEIEDDSPESN